MRRLCCDYDRDYRYYRNRYNKYWRYYDDCCFHRYGYYPYDYYYYRPWY